MTKNALVFCFSLLFLFPFNLFAQSDENDELLYRKVRVTLVPGLSTNGLDAPRYSAKYSLNFLVGYHGALEGYELGLVNINRKFARGVQIGAVNATGGSMAGLQFASLVNLSADETQGIQFAGLSNVSGGYQQGIQFSGLGNFSGGYMQGIQFTGGLNFSDGMQGIQFAGLGNLSESEMQGLQFAGLFNVTGGSSQGMAFSGLANIAGGSAQGIYISGLINVNDSFQGIGGAGILNLSRFAQGVQISGIANIAERGQGIQIGLFNYARQYEGLPIGLISYYGDGRKNIDAWVTDGGFTHIGLNLGTHQIYNRISAGYNPLISDREVWSLGWSIGRYRTLDDAWERPNLDEYFSTHDFTIQRIFDGEWSSTQNFIYRYSYLLGKNMGNGLSLYAGPSLNLQVSAEQESSDYTWYSITEGSRSGRDLRFWVGFTAGMRLFGQ